MITTQLAPFEAGRFAYTEGATEQGYPSHYNVRQRAEWIQGWKYGQLKVREKLIQPTRKSLYA